MTPLTPQRFGLADLLGPLGIGTAAAVVYLWLLNQGLASLYSFDRAAGSLGLLTGLLSADLMILQVVLMARVPWVERAWGHDILAQRHRQLGFASFWLMMAHVVLFAIERVKRNPAAAAQELWRVFVTDSWMLLATAGTLMLILVVITSIRAARRRMRYESFHLIHLYAYAGMAFSFPHMLYDGADFHGAWARAFWWGLYLFALAVTLIWRVAVPLWRSLYHRPYVAGVRREADDVVTIDIGGHRLDRLGTRSGQFFVWRFLDGPGWSRGHPYTLSAAPRPDGLRITVKAYGENIARATRLSAGTRVLLEGPYDGAFSVARRRNRRILLIAAGIGITPVRALLEDAPYAPGDATIVYRHSEPRDGVLGPELREIARRRGAHLHFLPGPRRSDTSWLPAGHPLDDVRALRELVPDIADRDVYACGPAGWLVSLRRTLLAAGVHRDRLHLEQFTW